MNINKEKIKSDALLYLGYKNQNIDKNLETTINQCVDEIFEKAKPNITFKEFEISQNKPNETQLLRSNLVFESGDLFDLLNTCSHCVVFCATLGVFVDNAINIHEKTSQMTNALVLDSCATAFIEAFCDDWQNEIEKKYLQQNKFITWRFSPGYGDLALEYQPKILQILGAQKAIGLTVTPSLILIPRKSVTAIFGVSNAQTNPRKNSCESCAFKNSCKRDKPCNYAKRDR